MKINYFKCIFKSVLNCEWRYLSYLMTAVIFLFTIDKGFAQNIDVLEKEFHRLNQSIQNEKLKLDSLNNSLTKKAVLINQEKSKKDADKEKITSIMANTITLSNQVKAQQKKLSDIENELNQIKRILDQKYALKIDSLQNVYNSEENIELKSNLENIILKYIRKRLTVAPKIYTLSFDPQKILDIEMAGADSVELAIYNEYLSNALSEVDSQRVQINNVYDEIQQIIYLQKKADQFMDDVDSEFQFRSLAQTNAQKSNNEITYGSNDFLSEDRTKNISIQAHTYGSLLKQLEDFPTSKVQSTWTTPLDSIPGKISYQQYSNLLKEIEKRLDEYRLLLIHKLEMD